MSFQITGRSENISIRTESTSTPAVPASPLPAVEPRQPRVYGDVPRIPTQEAVNGIRFDFNDGIRILFPQNGREYHVTFTDIDTGIVLYSNDTVPGAFVTSVKKFYIRFRLIIHEKGGREPIFHA